MREARQETKTVAAECRAEKEAHAKEDAEAAVTLYKEKVRIDEENQQKAEEADVRADYWRSQYNAALLRYSKQAATEGTIHLSSTSEVTEGDYRSSDSTSILITLKDAGICAENTARLKAVNEWSKGYGDASQEGLKQEDSELKHKD